ncbi:MAG: nucleotide sugar dehydrogenase [Candidatus Obscuribacterales bacterium]|nr:nucleotide sugar dehydrogenase [Candidatus Obscuribacterales bacterium]
MDFSVPSEVCIIGGAGHVGLPLALAFAKSGKSVLIYDINEESLRRIAAGEVPFMEDGAEELLPEVLASGRLQLSSDPARVADAETVIITIGTPVDEFLNPVFKLIRNCIDTLLPHLRDGQLLVLRSTVYPGTTDWLARHLNDHGRNLLISFCPERVVQGKALEEIQKLPQLISGVTDEARDKAAKLFSAVAPEVVYLEPIEAEFAKLFNNAYRYIEFAIANEFYMIMRAAGVDYNRVLEGMSKNYPRAKNIPKPGFAAGPCLFKDTMQLSAFSNNRFSLGHSAMLVNEGLVLHIVDEIGNSQKLENLTVGLLGMAFKADNDDTRSSLSYKLKKVLEFRAKRVLTTDPHVTTDSELLALEEVIEKSDLLILCVPHSSYKGLDLKGKEVVDIWGFFNKKAEGSTPALNTVTTVSGLPLSGVQHVG